MNKILSSSCVGLALSATIVCGGCSSSSSTADWTPVGTTLDSFVTTDPVSPPGTVQGYSFALTDSHGTLYRVAGGAQTVDAVLNIASATKVPSSIAILTLVDAGKLDLDEPVQTYLDALNPGFFWPREKAPITMRMLLSHTAGIPSPADPTTSDCLSNTVTTLVECVQEVARTPLAFPPGTTFLYSGADYQVAGYVAQLIAGMSFTQLFASAVGEPLGLTIFHYNDEQNPRVAGGAYSNVDDYAKILRMILRDGVADNGTRVLSDAMIQELAKNQIGNVTFQPRLCENRI